MFVTTLIEYIRSELGSYRRKVVMNNTQLCLLSTGFTYHVPHPGHCQKHLRQQHVYLVEQIH